MNILFKLIAIASGLVMAVTGSIHSGFSGLTHPLIGGAGTVLYPYGGGTGTSTAPTLGQVLVGTAGGVYAPQATSTLGISGGGGSGIPSVSPFTSGFLPYATSSGTAITDSPIYYDSTTSIAIGTTTPDATIPFTVVSNNGAFDKIALFIGARANNVKSITVQNSTSTGGSGLTFREGNTINWGLFHSNASSSMFGLPGGGLSLLTGDSSNILLNPLGGFVGVGTSTPDAPLSVTSQVSNNGIIMHLRNGDNSSDNMIFQEINASDTARILGSHFLPAAWGANPTRVGNVEIYNDSLPGTAIGNVSGYSAVFRSDTLFVGMGTSSPDSNLDVYGSIRLEASSSVITSSIGGAIVSGGCDSVTTSVSTLLSSSTTAFITTPQNDPGSNLGGTWAYSFLSAPGVLTTRVCSNITVTPNTTPYIVKIIR